MMTMEMMSFHFRIVCCKLCPIQTKEKEPLWQWGGRIKFLCQTKSFYILSLAPEIHRKYGARILQVAAVSVRWIYRQVITTNTHRERETWAACAFQKHYMIMWANDRWSCSQCICWHKMWYEHHSRFTRYIKKIHRKYCWRPTCK